MRKYAHFTSFYLLLLSSLLFLLIAVEAESVVLFKNVIFLVSKFLGFASYFNYIGTISLHI